MDNRPHIVQALNEAEIAERCGNAELARAAVKRLTAAGYTVVIVGEDGPELEIPAEAGTTVEDAAVKRAAAKPSANAAPKGRSARPKTTG